MSIVVAYKYAANPQDTTVGSDGVVDWSRAKAAVSEYDPVAIQVARTVADAKGEELVGISVGDAQVNATAVAGALANLVHKVEGANILLTGDSSIDESAKMMSALVAGYLGWPCFQEVSAVEANGDGWTITQATASGTRTINVDGPVVVAVTTDAATVKVPGMKDVLQAGKKPMDTVALADLGIEPISVEVTGRLRPVAQERKKEILSGDDAAVKLVEALRSAGVL